MNRVTYYRNDIMKLIPKNIGTFSPWEMSQGNRRKNYENRRVRTIPLSLQHDVHDELDMMCRKMKSQLNKLSIRNFQKLLPSFITMDMNQDNAKPIIQILFEKALEETCYIPMYADLCKHLSETFSFFQKMIICFCQNSFETEENKRKMIGNIQFISELYRVNLISSDILMFCLSALLEEKNEKNIETACVLMLRSGFELYKTHPDQIKMFMEKLEAYRETCSVRICFKILDVTETRDNGWVSLKTSGK